MGLRGPGKNSGLNRENPDILIVMIAEKQIMRGGEEDKRDQNERERDGPSKACRGNKWHSATAPCKGFVPRKACILIEVVCWWVIAPPPQVGGRLRSICIGRQFILSEGVA
ncbi:hypothetical protein GBA52_028663 [Prunus armeniaca]|nr:hypothetical protein GBA52_028663 [Prunus armeniaca]